MKILQSQGRSWKNRLTKSHQKTIFLALVSILMSFNVFAQLTIQGKTTDKAGASLPNVSVVVKNTKTGTVSDVDGAYKINVANSTDVLIFTFIGYVPKEVVVGSQTTINVSLEENIAALDEVVVTGVFDKRTALNSSIAISTLNYTQIDKIVPTSAADLLKNVPGVFVNSSLGEIRNTVYSRGVSVGNNDGRWGYDYVSMQEDGLPVTNSLFANFGPDFFLRADATISKIEAVRGGSASIAGPNAPGGIFNYISKVGGDHFEGEIRTKFGLEGNGKNPYYRADFDFGGPLNAAKTLTYNVGGFYRQSTGSQDAGYPANYGGQIKANLFYKYKTGSLKFIAKYLNDHNLSVEATPTTSFTDIKPATGFDNTSSLLYPAVTQSYTVPGWGNYDYNPNKLWHSRDTKFGLNWEQNLGESGWKFSNNMSFASKNLTGYSPEGTASAIDLTNFVSYIILGSLHPGPPGAPGTFVVPGNYTFSVGGQPVITTTQGFDFSQPVPFAFKVNTNTTAGAAINPNSVLFTPLIIQDNKVNEFFDQFNFTKKTKNMSFNVGGFFGSSTLDRFVGSFGVTFNTIQNHPQPLNVTLKAPDGTVFQVTNPNGISKVGADQGYTDIRAKQGQMAFFLAHTWEINDKLTFDWGLRYENININGTNKPPVVTPATDGGVDKNPLTLYDNYTTSFGTPLTYDKTLSYLSYSGALNYKISNNSAIYVRYSNGNKAPTFNIYTDVTTQFGQQSLDPQIQNIQQFELGFKSRTGNLTTTITPFYSNLSHVPNSVSFTNAQGALYNPPAQYESIKTYGLELEGNLSLSKNLSVRGVVTLQDATATVYKSWNHLNDGTDVIVDNSGNKAANVPNLMMNITPEYSNGKFYGNITWSYLGARQANFANAFELPAFSQFNMALGYDVSSKLRLSGNINNLFNTYGVMNWIAPGSFPFNTNLESLSKSDVAKGGNTFYQTIAIPARAFFLTLRYKF